MKFYQVPGWPSSVAGHSAVTPRLVRHAASGAQMYKDGVTGQPGTQAIPTRSPSDLIVNPWATVARELAGQSRTDSPGVPGVFYPNLYYARPQQAFWPGAGMPVSVQSDNLMPVPAVDPRGIPSSMYKPINQRGQRQIRTLPNMPKWG